MRQTKILVLLPTLTAIIACSGTDSLSPDVSPGSTSNTGGKSTSGSVATVVGGNGTAVITTSTRAGSSGGGTLGATGTGGSLATGGTRAAGGSVAAGGSNNGVGNSAAGGTRDTGGTRSTGGATATGGRTGNASSTRTGGAANAGGAESTGGTAKTGGTASAGGSKSTGGTANTGGKAISGGSKSSGGTASTSGSTSPGGAPTTGGSGSNAGGTGTGGSSATCSSDTSAPPSNVSAWINESWASQLGDNIRNREAWLLDSVMMGKGQINLCVRWGASSAPTAAVKSGMAAAVQKWLNDWLTTLNYGGFPYCNGITAKVTGWAVKPGNESWVADLDSSIKVYTELDAEKEPKCPDACSFFVNWSHEFPKCAGGEAYHTDYWLWLDDSISGGAAAVGGDWGLRMPVSNFTAAMGKSNLVIEHEMGHGFGFQDYYDWKGSTPAGGSLMIVGSTNSQVPTTGDTWLLRRTWTEMKTLRGW